MRLEGKVALISGGGRGMGAAEARLFASEGAKVVFGDVLQAEGQQVEAEIAEAGGEAVFVHLDVTSESDWQNAVDTAVERFGGLHILVNNAGIWDGGNVEAQTVEGWDRTMDINAKGVFLGTKAAIPAMRESGQRLDCQHLVHGGHQWKRRLDGVQCVEGSREAAHQVHGDPVCRRGHPLQLGPSRSDRHEHDP